MSEPYSIKSEATERALTLAEAYATNPHATVDSILDLLARSAAIIEAGLSGASQPSTTNPISLPPADYPMVAPNYSKTRADMAHMIGLGRRPSEDKAAA